MSTFKRILRADRTRRFIAFLIAQWIRLVFWTGRWQTQGGEIPRPFWDEGKPFILAFWHGRLMMAPMAWRPGASKIAVAGVAAGRLPAAMVTG